MAPICPVCHKKMKPLHRIASGFDENLMVILEAIETYGKSILLPSKFGCTNKIPNPKYREYIKEKQKEDREKSTLMGAIKSAGKKSDLPQNPPPPMIPCPNHHTLAASGEWNDKVKRKKSKPIFDVSGFKISGGL